MDLFREIADMINPVQNAQILAEIERGQHKYTMTLGRREYETTNSDAAWSFVNSFKGKDSEPFKMSSKPYAGAEINSVVNTKQ
jgi:hypothetical protein